MAASLGRFWALQRSIWRLQCLHCVCCTFCTPVSGVAFWLCSEGEKALCFNVFKEAATNGTNWTEPVGASWPDGQHFSASLAWFLEIVQNAKRNVAFLGIPYLLNIPRFFSQCLDRLCVGLGEGIRALDRNVAEGRGTFGQTRGEHADPWQYPRGEGGGGAFSGFFARALLPGGCMGTGFEYGTGKDSPVPIKLLLSRHLFGFGPVET